MFRSHEFFVLVLCLSGLASIARAQSKPVGSDPFHNEALVLERSETTYRMRADGTGERDIHVRVRIQSDGAAQQFGVLSFSYASGSETPAIKYVRVLKADGSTVETPVSDAIDMPSAVSQQAPLYSDLKEKHVPVRSLSAGDVLEYEVDTAIEKAETPGQFWGADHFTAPGTLVVLAEVLNLEVPADKYVQVWSPNHKAVVSDHDGVRTYTWDVAQLVTAPKSSGDEASKAVAPKDPDEDGDGRKVPSVAWTTFHSWTEVGDWYRNLSLKRAEPSDAVKAEAEELTKTAKTPEEQVRALYGYVSGHTRYVGIDFGIGRYQPHTAAEVLANQYGDCKDKDTLLEALLRAKGIGAAPALIGAGIAPVEEVPSPAVFNHVITTVNLAGGRIWLDSTPQAAPFEYLSAVIRDQKALIVPATGAAGLEATPAAAPYPFTSQFEATATLDGDGKLTGKISSTYRDDDEVVVRALARNVARAEWDKASQYVSSATGFGGTTSETQFANADDVAEPIKMMYTYQRHPYGDWDSHRIVPLLPVAEFPALDSDGSAPQEDIQLGAPRTMTAVSRIHLPEGYRTNLPDPVHVKTEFATLDKTYQFDGNDIKVERKVVVLKKKIAREDWKKYQAFYKDASLDGEAWIQLMPPEKGVVTRTFVAKPAPPSGAPAVKEGNDKVTVVQLLPAEEAGKGAGQVAPAVPDAEVSASSSPAELMRLAGNRLGQGDMAGAREALDKVKEKNPDQEKLWATYAVIAEMERNYDEARADLEREIAKHPDDSMVVGALAAEQVRAGDAATGRRTVQRFLEKHPDNAGLSLYLARLQTNAEDYGAALKTLEAAADQSPDNNQVRLSESEALRRMHRNEEAAAAAQSVLAASEDAEELNDGAYALGETGVDLPVAEAASRKAIAMLEAKSTTVSTAEVNSRMFADANLLVASWDTLGWILYREGKLDEARQMIEASWRASLQAEVGAHLGKIEEAMGQKEQAGKAYVLAQAALNGNVAPDVRADINEGLAELKAEGVKPAEASATSLQDLRTYKIAKPAGVSGWATFRLEIAAAGVVESQEMTRDNGISGIKKSLDAMKFPELLPPGSKAHLLRSAVVSCAMSSNCEVILVPDGGLQTEQ